MIKECKSREIWAKGLCNACYKRYGTPKHICLQCGQLRPHKAKGLCQICYARTRLPKIKDYNAKRTHNITATQYQQITGRCIICGFDKIVELHHQDKNHNNNDPSNLVGLCPNHHKMAHMIKYAKEIEELIQDARHTKKNRN